MMSDNDLSLITQLSKGKTITYNFYATLLPPFLSKRRTATFEANSSGQHLQLFNKKVNINSGKRVVWDAQSKNYKLLLHRY